MANLSVIKQVPHFDGATYTPELDHRRLANQLLVIKELMLDGVWRTLVEIEAMTGFRPASISAQLRHLRKERFGGYAVQKRRRGKGRSGLYEYLVLAPMVVKEDSSRQLCFI